MANNIAVSITVDVADLTAKRAVMSAELKAATADLNAFARTARTSGMTDELRASMLAAGGAVAKARVEVRALDGDLKKLAATATKTAPEMRSFEEVKAGVMGFGAGMIGFGVAVTAGLGEMAKRAAEASEHVEHLSQETGMSVEQIQELGAIATMTGTDMDGLVKGVGRLDLAFARARAGSKQQIEAFDAIGVSVKENVNNWDLLGQVADKFAGMADGPAKAALAIQLFGKAGLDLIPILDLGKAGIEAYRQAVDAYGVKSKDAQDKGEALARSFNENKVAMTGLTNVFLSAAAPAIKAVVDGVDSMIKGFVQAYQAGGATKTMIDFLVVALKASFVPIETVGLVFAEAWDLAKHSGDIFKAEFEVVKQEVLTDIDVMTSSFRSFATAVGSALAGNWAGAAQAGMDGVNQALQASERHSGALTIALTNLGAANKAWLGDATRDLENYKKGLSDLFNGSDAKGLPSPKGQGDTSGDPSGHKGGSKQDDQVAEWTAQLQLQLENEKAYFADSNAEELKFWNEKIGLVKAGSEAWRQIHTKIYDLDKAAAHTAYDEHVALLNDQLEADKASWAKEQADWEAKLAYIKSVQGEESAAYKEAHKAFEAEEQAHQDTARQIAHEAMEEALRELKANLDAQRALRESQARGAESQIQERGKSSPFGQIAADQQIAKLHQQLLLQQAADDAAYQAKADAVLQDDIDGAKRGTIEYQKAVDAKALADLEFHNKHQQLEAEMVSQAQQDATKLQQTWHQYVDGAVSTTGSALMGLANKTETWAQAEKSVVMSVANAFMQAGEKWVETWIVSMVTGEAYGKTGAAAQVANAATQVAANAAIAGSAGVASMAAAPFPIDTGAPAFGASMAAAAMSFGGFSRGLDVVPNDMIAQIHAGERIVPAADNSAMISAMQGSRGGSAKGGDLHAHFSPTVMSSPWGSRQEAMADIMPEFQRRAEKMLGRLTRGR